MKEHCAYYPIAIPTPADRRWDTPLLDRLATTGGDYFIPVGILGAGDWELLLQRRGEGPLRVELLSSEFESVVDDCFDGGAQLKIPFHIDDTGRYVLRLRGKGGHPLRLSRLQLGRVARGPATGSVSGKPQQ
ncbi:MAG TPA: hypothetical protein ENK50_07475 [Sedimenticola sp.]|nr:hypothetical protein [Sedimenticola sp.]